MEPGIEPNGSTEREGMRELESKARRLGRSGDFGPEALTTNTRIIERDPRNTAALARRGRAHLERGDEEAARRDFEQVLRTDPSNTFAREALNGNGWAEEHGRTRARRRAAGSRRPTGAAETTGTRHRCVGAVGFREACDIGAAASQGSRPDFGLAVAAFERAWSLQHSDRCWVPVMLANAYRHNGRLREAEEFYEWVVSRRGLVYERTGLAAVYADRGKYHAALALAEEIIREYPHDVYASNVRDRTRAALGSTD